MPGGFEFSPMPTARGCPRAGGAEFLSAVAQGATAGQGPAAFPSPGDSGCRLGPKPRGFPLRRVARGALVPMARSLPLPVAGGCPLAGGSGSPQARGLRCPVAGWLRVSPCQRLGDPRCRVAPGFSVPEARRRPLPGGSGSPPRRVAESLLFAGGSGFPPGTKGPRIRPLPVAPGFLRPEAREFPLPGGSGCLSGRDLKSSLCRFGSGVSPVALAWVSPSPATVPGGREISTPVSRAAQEVSADNFKILWPSTSHPQLTLGCPPRQTFLHRILHSLVHRLCGLCPGQHP